MDDWDPTDRVLVIVHGADSSEHHDDSPTSPIVVVDDHTTRHVCEFEEDTVEEFFV